MHGNRQRSSTRVQTLIPAHGSCLFMNHQALQKQILNMVDFILKSVLLYIVWYSNRISFIYEYLAKGPDRPHTNSCCLGIKKSK